MRVTVLIVVVLVLLLVWVYKTNTTSTMEINRDGVDGVEKIPRKVWTFWDSEPVPEFIQKCIDTWGSDIDVNVITKDTIRNYLTDEELSWKYIDNPAKLSDLIRLSVLAKHGGVWLDASIVCYESLDWVFKDGAECILYQRPLDIVNSVLPESWFIACTPGNPVITAWYEEFMKVSEYDTIDDYVQETGIGFMDGIEDSTYLLVYVCGKKVYDEMKDQIKLIDARTGPRRFAVDGNNGILDLCDETIPRPEFAKITHEDRAEINKDSNLESCIFRYAYHGR